MQERLADEMERSEAFEMDLQKSTARANDLQACPPCMKVLVGVAVACCHKPQVCRQLLEALFYFICSVYQLMQCAGRQARHRKKSSISG